MWVGVSEHRRLWRRAIMAAIGGLVSSEAVPAQELISYAADVAESTVISMDAASVGLGPPDYVFTEGAFTSGASVTFTFRAPLDDIPGTDLFVYAFVTGTGTASTTVLVEARAAPDDPFVEVATLETADARISDSQNYFAGFDHVHAFGVNFDGRARKVTEVRLIHAAGDELKLDALEGVHPALSSPGHAVEMRIFRLRDDESKRFALRFKNMGSLEVGVAMSGFAIEHATAAWIDQTDKAVVGVDGEFVATPETTAGPDNGATTQRTDYVWSMAGAGLNPGQIASHQRIDTIDTDTVGDEFLENFTFTIRFADGVTASASGLEIVQRGGFGQLFALYQIPPFPVSISGPRPAFWYEFADGAVVPETICTDCADGDPDDNGNDNDNGNPPPRMCSTGLIGPLLVSLLACVLHQAKRRRMR